MIHDKMHGLCWIASKYLYLIRGLMKKTVAYFNAKLKHY